MDAPSPRRSNRRPIAARRRSPRRAGVAEAALKLRATPGDVLDVKRHVLAEFCKVMVGKPTSSGANGTGDATDTGPELPPLAPRLRQTLLALLAGDSEKQIARRLQISPHTAHVYVKSLYRKFAVCSRGELLARWVRPGVGGAPPATPRAPLPH